MIPATEGVFRLQIKSKSSMPWTARGCRPLRELSANAAAWNLGSPNSLDEASCLITEEHMLRLRAQWPAGSVESSDVVVGRDVVVGVGAIDSRDRSARQRRAIHGRSRHFWVVEREGRRIQ